jgi:high-affinity Fe2+/Pb2+ permease
VAFLVACHEVAEIVPLFAARALAGSGAELAMAAGLATGIAVLLGLITSVLLVTPRMERDAALFASGAVLTVVALSLVGQGVHALQEGGHLHVLPLPGWARLPFLGVHSSAEGLTAQGLALLGMLLLAWLGHRGRRAHGLTGGSPVGLRS